MTAQALVIGGGPSGLMAAETLVASGLHVRVIDRMPSLARKFLLAGRGGLNLTHSEPLERLLERYGPARPRLERALRDFPPDRLVRWCEDLELETFVGSSGRVFPKTLKASPLLRAWLRRLEAQGASFALRRRWTGWSDDGALTFEGPEGGETARPDVVVLALGGASWPRLGADGAWTGALEAAGVAVAPLAPANCGFRVGWSSFFAERFAGQPLKRIALTFDGETRRGEALVTGDGIEGGLVYAFSAPLRDAIARDGSATAALDLRPDLAEADLAARIGAGRGDRSLSTHLRKAAGLPPVCVALLREGGDLPREPDALARRIKATPLQLVAPQGLARAISTAGGVRFDELDERFMLTRRPGVFVAGEMLDWEAPTGGYLLQACFATGRAAAEGAAAWMRPG
ncbi:putative flavoprotein (TIGR03862 family) [Methylopila capsulata]|uniref:Flavoprotein (TIGR03862 family) n=1 Tax=Methylopila capsulata TaxID=61654 RepID=A0A9W6ISA9_9HYPH|nr:TIGR03862 family flavoprotein [Methylopila capsulata]MBM7850285.1 putative flavoprotein (TIGR03862 family) [Methylopila capsulata]GLK55578.1 NAD(FAD)-utilizing dehydrogenase [Methylopila capsulata]